MQMAMDCKCQMAIGYNWQQHPVGWFPISRPYYLMGSLEMHSGRQIVVQKQPDKALSKHAVTLLSQQIWCWGRDILRSEGNWLLEIGFERIEPPPEERENTSSSVYSLTLPNGGEIVLRGYGIFYGDKRYGGIFLPRYEFLPLYTTISTLQSPPWTKKDLPALEHPIESQIIDYSALVKDLVDWIHAYEQEIVDQLGVEYRRFTLSGWDDGTRTVIAAEEIVDEWSSICAAVREGLLLN